VLHCTAGADLVHGIALNYPGAAAKRTGGVTPARSADTVPDTGPEAGDIVMRRHHGVSPFTGTDLDALLRGLGIRTVVACSVSLHVGTLTGGNRRLTALIVSRQSAAWSEHGDRAARACEKVL